jgi:Translation initiation factor eIF3 subunit 135
MVHSETYEKEKELVDNLGKFLVETQIPKIVKEMQGFENVPNDHQSLCSYLHSNGINMRYLGQIHAGLKASGSNHMAQFVE